MIIRPYRKAVSAEKDIYDKNSIFHLPSSFLSLLSLIPTKTLFERFLELWLFLATFVCTDDRKGRISGCFLEDLLYGIDKFILVC